MASHDAPPSGATDAVLMKSEAMPEGSQPVEELDFNKLKRPITAEDLYLGMRHMGFQASSMAEAIRIINNMASSHSPLQKPSLYDPLHAKQK